LTTSSDVKIDVKEEKSGDDVPFATGNSDVGDVKMEEGSSETATRSLSTEDVEMTSEDNGNYFPVRLFFVCYFIFDLTKSKARSTRGINSNIIGNIIYCLER